MDKGKQWQIYGVERKEKVSKAVQPWNGLENSFQHNYPEHLSP